MLEIKAVKAKVGFDSIYKDLHSLLKDTKEGEGVELRAVKEHYRISPNKLKDFREGLPSWHMAVVEGASESRGKGPLMVVFTGSRKTEKEEEEKPKRGGKK